MRTDLLATFFPFFWVGRNIKNPKKRVYYVRTEGTLLSNLKYNSGTRIHRIYVVYDLFVEVESEFMNKVKKVVFRQQMVYWKILYEHNISKDLRMIWG